VLNRNGVADSARGVHTDNEVRALAAEHEVRRARAENEKLRETVMQLAVEINDLREQAARRLAHRILDRMKQAGQALRALAIAFDGFALVRRQLAARLRDSERRVRRVVVHGLVAAGIAAARTLAHRILDGVKQARQALRALAIAFDGLALVRRQLAARLRDSERRARRVVVHGLVAAGIALAMSIVAFLSLQDVAMLGGPSERAGTIALSEQEVPEAAARSGALPVQAEKPEPSAAKNSPASVAEISPAMGQGPAPAAQLAQPTPAAVVAIDNPPTPPQPQLPIQSQSPPTSPPVNSPVSSASPQSADSVDLQQANQTPPTVDDKELSDPAAREAIARGWASYYLPYTSARWQQARREFEQAFEIDPRSGEARIGLAAILSTKLADGWSPVLQEDLPRAEHLLLEAVDNGSVSNRAAAHFTLGVLRRMQNRLPEAQAELESAISLDPNNARAYLHLGETLLYLGEPEAAIPLLEQATRVHSDDPSIAIIYWALGACRLLSGRLDQAIESLQNARAANPHLWMPHLYLAGAYGLQGDLEAAKSALKESMRLKPAIRSLAGMRAENPWLTNPQYWALQEKTLNVGLRRAGLPDQWSAEVASPLRNGIQGKQASDDHPPSGSLLAASGWSCGRTAAGSPLRRLTRRLEVVRRALVQMAASDRLRWHAELAGVVDRQAEGHSGAV
jgi:tetratricopeptide (TPR) repeat protein